MFSGLDYLGAVLAALMILGPLAAGQSHDSDRGTVAPMAQSQ
jgi:hypothetical protein